MAGGTEVQVIPLQSTPATIGGKEFGLRYSWAARKRLIARAGGEDKLREMLSGDMLVPTVLEGIKGADKQSSLTEDELSELIDLREILELATAIATAMGYKAVRKETPVELPDVPAQELDAGPTSPPAEG